MPDYTFTLEHQDLQDEHTEVQRLPDDAVAVTSAGQMLSPQHISVSVARGTGDQAQWLGAWDWCDGHPRWTPDEET